MGSRTVDYESSDRYSVLYFAKMYVYVLIVTKGWFEMGWDCIKIFYWNFGLPFLHNFIKEDITQMNVFRE